MVRAFMGKKKMVEVCEWITIVGSGTWIVPEGCKTIDYCVVAGGANGGSGNDGGGAGGSGGGYSNVYKFDVSMVKNIAFSVGVANANSAFGRTTVTTGTGPSGGSGASSDGNGENGSAGIYPFDNNNLFKRFCTGGGGGAHSRTSKSTNEGVYNDKYGGAPNGGNASSYSWYDTGWNAHYGQSANPGGGGAYYGAGGGGGGFGYSSMFGNTAKGSGGSGYQGCIILMYERRKRPEDIVGADGIVRINWPVG